MKKTILALLLILPTFASGASRCSPQIETDDYLFVEDFPWNQSLEAIKLKADALYVSPKRLMRRGFRNARGEAFIPVDALGKIKNVRVTELFIKSVTLHIEEALKRKYVDAIHFGDMGHSHFFIPQKFYDEVLDPIPVQDKDYLYEKMLAHKELKILYHTAEQLVMKTEEGELLPDRHIQWRFFTRNLVGDNKGLGKLELLHNEEHAYNTANNYEEGYRYWGSGYYVSAHEQGCFPFKHNGKTYYFDLNLEGINPGPHRM
jgi:hypothetical protein